MRSTEIFNIATWNFLMGDRSVEEILKDKRLSRINVRGGLGTVLSTIAGIKDMEKLGWKEEIEGKITVPVNALSSHSPYLEEKIDESEFYKYMLNKSYGIQSITSYQYYEKQVIIVLNMTEENKGSKRALPSVIDLLRQARDEKIIFTSPYGEKLLPELREYARKSWSNLYWDGFNAFFSDRIEEAVLEANPDRILVIGSDEEEIFYTAIGGADYFIIQDSYYRDPESLQLWDLMEIGKKVSVLMPCKKGGVSLSIKDLSIKHLTEKCKVNVIEDYEYTPVEDHKIMIDII